MARGVAERVIEDVECAITVHRELEVGVTLPVPNRDCESVDPRIPPQRDLKIIAGAAGELSTW
jgi:hypothetical protein